MHLWRLYNHVHRTFVQFVKFCVVGLSGLAVDTAVLMLLVENLGLDPRFAAVFSFAVAVSWNYRWNRSWTFGVGRETRWLSGFAAFAVVCLAGLCVRLTTMHLLMRYGGMGEGYWYILASIIGIVTGIAANFTGSKCLVFGRTAADAEAAPQSQ